MFLDKKQKQNKKHKNKQKLKSEGLRVKFGGLWRQTAGFYKPGFFSAPAHTRPVVATISCGPGDLRTVVGARGCRKSFAKSADYVPTVLVPSELRCSNNLSRRALRVRPGVDSTQASSLPPGLYRLVKASNRGLHVLPLAKDVDQVSIPGMSQI